MSKPDPAHVETDKIIEQIEKRIAKEYAQAEKEVAQKLDNYLKKFETKDKTWQKWVAEGKKTEKEYKEWKTGQIAIGERWEALRQNLADDYHNANMIAKSVIQGHMPEVYAINHNYATYEIEHGLKIDTSYTLYDRQTVERIFAENPKMLHDPGKEVSKNIAAGLDKRWNNQQIQSVMLQSILQGEAIPKIATRLSREVGDSNRKAAIRNARTMTTGAENAGRVDGYYRAQEMGIEMEQMWVATLDGRTRHSHRQLDGETVKVGEVFSNGCRYPGDPDGAPEEIYNCFTGNVYVTADSDIERSYKHEYKGKLVTIKTAGGVEFTCTPNHPILTPSGWIGADFLNEGDDICVTFVFNKRSSRINPNINHIFASFEAVHKFFSKFGGQRTSSLSVNFHGDIPASNVEIIGKKRLLRDDWNISKFKKHSKLGFEQSDPFALGICHTFKSFWRICKTTFRDICSKCKSFPFFWRGLGHSKVHRFRTIAGSNISIPQYSINNLPATTVIRRELLDGLSGRIFLDNIISINKISGSAHVYNLQTENGYYFVNSIIANKRRKYNGNIVAIAKNCRCTLIAQLSGYETDITDMNLRHSEKLGDMSYDEWKKAKAESQSITLPEEKVENIKQSYIAEYRRK